MQEPAGEHELLLHASGELAGERRAGLGAEAHLPEQLSDLRAERGGIDRRRKRDVRRAITQLSEALQHGTRVVLFPEGTTSTGRQVLRVLRDAAAHGFTAQGVEPDADVVAADENLLNSTRSTPSSSC